MELSLMKYCRYIHKLKGVPHAANSALVTRQNHQIILGSRPTLSDIPGGSMVAKVVGLERLFPNLFEKRPPPPLDLQFIRQAGK
jgi:hypothetical protein